MSNQNMRNDQNANKNLGKKENTFLSNFTDPYVLIMLILVVAAILTYIVPAGVYERIKDPVTGKMLVDPASYTLVENTPVGLFDILQSVQLGLISTSKIIFFMIIIAGAFEVLNLTGFTHSLIGLSLRKFKGKDKILFFSIITLFAFLASTVGLATGSIVFIPLIFAMCRSLGYDELVAVALVYCGNRAGHINGMMNPFSIGVAHGITGLPTYSGLWYRSIWFVVTITVTFLVIYFYGQKIKKKPESSIMYGVNEYSAEEMDMDMSNFEDFTPRQKVVGAVLFSTFAIVIYGVAKYKWGLNELAGVFLGFGIVTGAVAGMSAVQISKGFMAGSKTILTGALIVGVSRAILVVLQDGQIIDTIVYNSTNLLSDMPKVLAVNGMYVFQWVLNLVIPSGSGQAATTMPIMAPIADVLDINRQVAVTAFHYGDGITNLITPASGPLMGALAVGKVPFAKWAKWVPGMLLAWTIIGFAAVTVAQLINFGPF